MSRNELMRHVLGLSSGTMANLIDSTAYVDIDNALLKAVQYVERMNDAECNECETFADICDVIVKANKKGEIK